MTGQAQAEYLVTALVERFTQGPEAVRRIRHAVQQQYPADRCVGIEFEAAVPVGLALLRVGGTAAAVAHQRILGSGCGVRVDFLFQLCKQLVFQLPVIIEAGDLIRLLNRKFRTQLFGVPGLQGRTAAPLHGEQNKQACNAA